MSNHTPGPLVRCTSDGERGNYLETAGSVIKFCVAEKIDGRYFDLFAAAPELLEALRQAWACIEHLNQFAPTGGEQDDAFKTMNEIEDAIAKATGGAE